MLPHLIKCHIAIIGCIALAEAYSHQTFLWTISSVCRSVHTYVHRGCADGSCVRRSVGLSVCPVHSGKMADRIWMPFGIVGRMGPGMRQMVGFGDRSSVHEKGYFWGRIWARHCPNGPIGRTCATAPRRGPLPKLLWADLLFCYRY